MSAVLVKFLHILAISVWAGGLMCLPSLYVQRRRLSGDGLHRLHNFTRFFYVALVSPSAFVAVASGIALIFMQSTFDAWFSVKLALVAALVIIHVTSGALILRLFEPGQTYPFWRFAVVSTLTVTVICLILVVVLGKPQWTTPGRVESLFAPGALGTLFGDLIAWSK
ncbi:MAG: CopD family protein [Devosia sp.]